MSSKKQTWTSASAQVHQAVMMSISTASQPDTSLHRKTIDMEASALCGLPV